MVNLELFVARVGAAQLLRKSFEYRRGGSSTLEVGSSEVEFLHVIFPAGRDRLLSSSAVALA